MPHSRLKPKIITVLKEGYTGKVFLHDLSAGVIVGIVALPLAIAFAIASGVKPEAGLYTAIVAGFVIALLSGSRVQIGGPTGAFVVMIYGIVQKFGYDGLVTATLLAGVILILCGVFRFGSVIKFIPYPVTVGFTTGIALIIAVSQVKDFLGLPIDHVPAEFLAKWPVFFSHLSAINPWAVGIGLFTIAVLVVVPRFAPRFPASLAAVLATTAAVTLAKIPVATIGTLFGSVPAGFPAFRLPNIDLSRIPELLPSAVAIAFLAGIESLLSAVVADGMTGRRHRSNMELVAQGAANIASVLFGGIPATGAIARTATNIKSGGTTPFAGIFHSLTLLVIMLFAGPYVTYIPMPTLAGILLVVSWRMSEARLFIKLFRTPKSDVLVLIVTFALTVLFDLTVAIQAGIVLGAILFMRRMSQTAETRYITGGEDGGEDDDSEEDDDSADPDGAAGRNIPPGVEVFEINGPFFFGVADTFRNQLAQVRKKPQVLILLMHRVPAIDATALRALEDIVDTSKKEKTAVILSGVMERPRAAMERYGLVKKLGVQNIVSDIDRAIDRARETIGADLLRR